MTDFDAIRDLEIDLGIKIQPFDHEPEIHDEVLCCPDCERPNQFGELCSRCYNDARMADEDLAS